MDGKMLARLGAVVFVAVAITATAIEMNRKEEVREAWPSGRTTQAQGDPLRDELIRCQVLGEAGPRDPACLRAWAENRNRFLAPGARDGEPRLHRVDLAMAIAGIGCDHQGPKRRQAGPVGHKRRRVLFQYAERGAVAVEPFVLVVGENGRGVGIDRVFAHGRLAYVGSPDHSPGKLPSD